MAATKPKKRRTTRQPGERRRRGGQLPSRGDGNFRAAVEQAGRWAEVRVHDSGAPAWFARALELRTEPTQRRAYEALMARAIQEERAIRRRLKSLDWSRVRGDALAVLIEGYGSLGRGINGFLPRPYREWPEHVRRALYVDWWILAARDAGVDPALPVRAATVTALLGPQALRELCRRAFSRTAGHVGFAAGAFPLMVQAGDDPSTLFRALRKMAWKHIPRGMQEEVDFEELKGMADEAIGVVLAQRLGQRDPLESAAAGVDGKWDIIPTAIGNVLSKEWNRRIRPSRDIEISFETLNQEGRLLSGDEEALDPEDTRTPSPEAMLRVRQLLEAIEADPKLSLAWQAEVSRKTLEEFAKDSGVNSRTLRRHRKTLKGLKDKV